MLRFFNNTAPSDLPIEKIKDMAHVLIIDDEDPKELKTLIKKDGWQVNYLNDLDSLENKKLK